MSATVQEPKKVDPQLMKLRDVESGATELLDRRTGKVYDLAGRQLRQLEQISADIVAVTPECRRRHGREAEMQCVALSDTAARHYYKGYSEQAGKPLRLTCREPRSTFNPDGRLVTMDLGINDVHIAAALPNFAGGYHIAEGVADIASPPILVPKASDKYFVWNNTNEFQRKMPNSASPGSAVAEVNPTLSNSPYTTVEYALGAFVPTEIQANADAPLRPFQKAVQMIVDNLRLEREIRVANLMETSGTWSANLVQTLAAGAQWDGGASSDPVANLHKAIEQSFLKVTGIIWSELVEHDFVRNPAVQKYVGSKVDLPGIPDMAEFAATLRLPPIYTATMKYVVGGNLTYVWGNHVVLIHEPPEKPPQSQQDIASNYSFRWNGGEAPDGTMTAGFLVRTYYDPKRGGRGGTQVVVIHNDAEVQTSNLVGGLILNAHQ